MMPRDSISAHIVSSQEERGDPDKQCFHLCIINLVIGTLYCAKGGLGLTLNPNPNPNPNTEPSTAPKVRFSGASVHQPPIACKETRTATLSAVLTREAPR